MENFWPACLSRFEQELSTQQFKTWIKPLKTEIVENNIRVIAPNKFVQQWVKDRFLNKIEGLAEDFFSHDVVVEITTCAKEHTNTISSAPRVISQQKEKAPIEEKLASSKSKKSNNTSKDQSGLNYSFNFDNYVTGRANQLARAAAIQ
ncbi:MAG TPA: DnaA N-terminal domain-containing protein, partial [Methylophilaceae bacterium]|nr:DnaA N-terminal domain-containing protein [Methylophilaceae bacterium]